MIALTIGTAVALFVFILLIRAAFFRPRRQQCDPKPVLSVEINNAAAHLSQVIQKRTVWNLDESKIDKDQFNAFIDLLPSLYPDLHRIVQRERVKEFALLYRWEGRDHSDPLVLMSHYDVVGAADEGWKYPPFGGVIAEGRIWGRGALDTKVTMISIFEAADKLIREGFIPQHDIYFSFSHNEEPLGDGAPAIVELFKERGITPGLVVDEGGAVVEKIFPGVKKPIAVVGVAEKGVLNLELSVKSAGGHSSTPPKETAAGILAHAIAAIEDNPFPAHFPAPTIEMFRTLGRHTPFGFRIIFANLFLFKRLLLFAFTRNGGETNAMGRTTVAVTMLSGSDTVNVLPPRVSSAASIRIAVGETVDEVFARIRSIINDPRVEMTMLYHREPSRVSDMNGDGWRIFSAVINETYPSAIVAPYVMLGASDSTHYSKISKDVFRFSPLELSKEERGTMHAVNESVPLKSLSKSIEFYLRLISRL